MPVATIQKGGSFAAVDSSNPIVTYLLIPVAEFKKGGRFVAVVPFINILMPVAKFKKAAALRP